MNNKIILFVLVVFLIVALSIGAFFYIKYAIPPTPPYKCSGDLIITTQSTCDYKNSCMFKYCSTDLNAPPVCVPDPNCIGCGGTLIPTEKCDYGRGCMYMSCSTNPSLTLCSPNAGCLASSLTHQANDDGCVKNWSYQLPSKTTGPYADYSTAGGSDGHDGGDNPWCMLPAYVKLFPNFKFTDDLNDPDCLTNWKYHDTDQKTVLQENVPRTIVDPHPFYQNKRFCPTATYISGTGTEPNTLFKYLKK